ncbi:MAG: zinc-ribbon domain-containing protein [Streptosporangiaceae bacterium]
MLSDVSSPEIIAMDDYDGPNVTKVVATAVRVLEAGSELKTLVKLREVKIDIYITDGRVALACEKYDKGGGWVGFGGAGLLVAVTANAVSKARAASRSRGKVLVGHIRYPWLKSVGASSKSGFTSDEAIRLEYSEKGPGAPVRKMLELTLPKNIDAALVAQDITRRAAAHRLAYYPDMPPEQRAKFAGLSQAPPLDPPSKKFAFHQMPAFFYASAGTAFPRPPQSGTPRANVALAARAPSSEPRAAGAHRTEWTTGPGVHAHGAPAGVGVSAGLGDSPGPGQTVKFCTQCGRRTVEGDNFCEACGASVKN